MFMEFSGTDAILFNAANLFKIVGIENEKLVAISVGISQLIGNILSCFLVDKVGRRKLLLTSALVMSLSLITLGVFFAIFIPAVDGGFATDADTSSGSTSPPAEEISWLPVSSIFLFNLMFSLVGATSVGFNFRNISSPRTWICLQFCDHGVRSYAVYCYQNLSLYGRCVYYPGCLLGLRWFLYARLLVCLSPSTRDKG